MIKQFLACDYLAAAHSQVVQDLDCLGRNALFTFWTLNEISVGQYDAIDQLKSCCQWVGLVDVARLIQRTEDNKALAPFQRVNLCAISH